MYKASSSRLPASSPYRLQFSNRHPPALFSHVKVVIIDAIEILLHVQQRVLCQASSQLSVSVSAQESNAVLEVQWQSLETFCQIE
jgi:hypothetical protein